MDDFKQWYDEHHKHPMPTLWRSDIDLATRAWDFQQAKVAEQFESIDTLQRYHHKRYAALQADVERYRKVIERLGSSEAFDVSRGFKRPQDDELIARMDYAKAALKQEGE